MQITPKFFRVLFLFEHKHIGRFSNLRKCTFKFFPDETCQQVKSWSIFFSQLICHSDLSLWVQIQYCIAPDLILFSFSFFLFYGNRRCYKSCQLINSDQIELPLVAYSNINDSLLLCLT